MSIENYEQTKAGHYIVFKRDNPITPVMIETATKEHTYQPINVRKRLPLIPLIRDGDTLVSIAAYRQRKYSNKLFLKNSNSS